MSIILETLSVPDKPYEVSEDQLSRYAEWQFTLEDKILGELTPEELATAPSLGLDRENGIWFFRFEQGNLYVEVENKQVRSIAGYSIPELSIFNMIAKEHGNLIRQRFEEQQIAAGLADGLLQSGGDKK